MLDENERVVAGQPPRPRAARRLDEGEPSRRSCCEPRRGRVPVVIAVRASATARSARLPEQPLGRPRRLRGAPRRLHRCRLARAAHAARAAARPARDGCAPRRRRRRADRAGARRGRADRRADRRRPLPQRARDGPRGRLARPTRALPRAARGASTSMRERAPTGRRDRRRRVRGGRRAAAAAADARGWSPEPRRERDPLRGRGADFTLAVERRRRQRSCSAADDGTGVADEDLARLFERFYRTDRARSSRGTGLGLAIVKHIVTSAGGTVEATETPGGGLTITCVFPV